MHIYTIFFFITKIAAVNSSNRTKSIKQRKLTKKKKKSREATLIESKHNWKKKIEITHTKCKLQKGWAPRR